MNFLKAQYRFIEKNAMFPSENLYNLLDKEKYVEVDKMNYFMMSKYQSIDENIIFASKTLYELLEEEKHIDQLFEEYAKTRNVMLNLNLERILYLALTFLFSIGKLVMNNNMVKRCNI